ncbi:MAG: protein kinase, partial [Myxococcales bacterium]|nr:protein kinase [Myxococcales bacterium]
MQLSGFTTGDLLHRGADATVWSATERRTGRRVAIKRARTDETTLREAQRLMVAQGEGVVELIGVVQTDEGAAIMLERAGESLKQRLLERGPLPPREALTIALGVARTLTRLHDAGVIHRDIKPSNLLAAEDERGWLLMDFGVAAQLEKDADTVESRALVGSAPYVPPEQTGRVARGVDARADLYSLGVTLYELLCGEPPFTGESLMELVSAHLTREPPPLGERVPGLPEVVAAIVHKLLRKQPEDRYQSAVGLAEDLERCLEALARGDELASFELARSDRVPLRIPDELFGRARELDATLEHARAAWDGHGVVINLVAKPGYGRTRLLREVFAALARDGALCLAAASDDDARTPLAGFTRALRELARQLLMRDEDELGRWRERLNEALGGLGAVILELAPELRALLGEQPPLEELPPAKARTRLEQAMVRLLSGLGAPGRPLALYYADFERSDEAGQALL